MSYIPLKKDIIFDDSVKNNPFYADAMFILKTLGDTYFKDWAVNQFLYFANNTGNQNVNQSSLNLAANLKALVNREVHCDQNSIDRGQALINHQNPDLFTLLDGITSFILNIQSFEKAIIAIENNIENGNINNTKNHLTKDGQPPVYLPRSRQEPQTTRRR